MIKNTMIDSLFERGPTNQSAQKRQDDSRVREAADKTRTRITHAFNGTVKVRASIKRDHFAV